MRFCGLMPIGSVVRIGDADKRLIIIGRAQRKAGEEDLYDYCSVPFPEGYLDGEHLIFHDHGDITYIFRVGYINDAEMDLQQRLEDFLKEKRG